jgi:hypothetical protein
LEVKLQQGSLDRRKNAGYKELKEEPEGCDIS